MSLDLKNLDIALPKTLAEIVNDPRLLIEAFVAVPRKNNGTYRSDERANDWRQYLLEDLSPGMIRGVEHLFEHVEAADNSKALHHNLISTLNYAFHDYEKSAPYVPLGPEMEQGELSGLMQRVVVSEGYANHDALGEMLGYYIILLINKYPEIIAGMDADKIHADEALTIKYNTEELGQSEEIATQIAKVLTPFEIDDGKDIERRIEEFLGLGKVFDLSSEADDDGPGRRLS